MIRIQIYCNSCKQIVDATVAAKRGRIVAAMFEDSHLHPACMEEVPDGQDQEGAGGSEAEGSAPDPGRTPSGGEAVEGKVH